MLRRKSRGQSTLEYAALIAVIVSGLLIVQRYMNRAKQGNLKGAADQLGEQFHFTQTKEGWDYESSSAQTETLTGGVYSTSIDHNDMNKTDGYYNVDMN